jgi:prolyl-tRNA editing enzyme YbaK/EbsC (Cys-tRNA(Pro) deacylase)
VIGEALRRPDANDVRDITGFAIGGIPPFAHKTPLVTYMDAALLEFPQVWAAAGTPDAVFPIAPQRLAAAAGASIITVT